MEENISSPGRKRLIIVGSVLFVLLAGLIIFFLMNRRPPVIEQPITVAPTPSSSPQILPNTRAAIENLAKSALPAPAVNFLNWTGITKPASAPESAWVYTFKTTYTVADIQAMATKLGANGTSRREADVVLTYSSTNDALEGSLLAFDTKTGTFTYNSNKGVALPEGATVEEQSTRLLQNLGVYDTTLEPTASFKNKEYPGMTFIEYHRAWEKVKLPVLNPLGLLNMPEDKKVNELSVGKILGEGSTQNKNIYATTDNSDGYARRDDYNTMTLAIDDASQTVKLIRSSIRPLNSSPNLVSLASFDEAVATLKAGKYDYIFTEPAGRGTNIPWQTIYPNNQAVADNAEVTESFIAYLEQPGFLPQQILRPYYIMRGNAMLQNGYRVNFAAAVAATPRPTAQSPFIGQVEAQDVPNQGGQQQTTFEMSPIPTRAPLYGDDNAPILPTGSVNLPPTAGTGNPMCVPSLAAFNPIISVDFDGYTFKFGHLPHIKHGGTWYYIPTSTSMVQDSVLIANLPRLIENFHNAYDAAKRGEVPTPTPTDPAMDTTIAQTKPDDQGQKQTTLKLTPKPTTTLPPLPTRTMKEGKILSYDEIIGDILVQHEYCPTQITYSSPSIFAYGPEGYQMHIAADTAIGYADPMGSQWDVRISGDSLIANNVSRDYLYYEYTDETFNKPSTGWIIKKNGAALFVQTVIAPALGLNAAETARAIFELNHAASRATTDTIFVGLIDQATVAAAIPLAVSPQPDTVYRYHFFVSDTTAGSVSAPILSPLNRNGTMVLELGSYFGK